jgi:hypothetical protein
MGTRIFLLQGVNTKKTVLDRAYKKHVNNIVGTLNDETEDRWETYDIVITELMKQGKVWYYDEIKYRLTDGENPNEVILSVIERELEDSDELFISLKKRIENYIEEDFIKRFLL